MFLPQELIRKKRDKETIGQTEITDFIRGVVDGSVAEGQIAAFAMAVYLNGMSREECVAMTLAQRDSGDVLSWKEWSLPGPVIDKHSTGGVGDLTSLLLGPLLAACGGYVPMISGRGLGHTGGTLDKLAAIPGYRLTPDNATFQRIVRDVGVAIIGQTPRLAPADGRIYAIRDVTATVESVALITASILSKKLAAGLDALVMDVKVGSGAFMPSHEKSVELAQCIVDVGNGAGMRTAAVLTDMNQSLAPSGGNALEIRFAIDYLTGRTHSARVDEVTFALAAQALVLGGLATDPAHARRKLIRARESGAAAERFAAMVAALGGPTDLVDAPDRYLRHAPVTLPVAAPRAGVVARIDCRALGMAIVGLGGGRRRPEDRIDADVGLTALVELGAPVEAGQPLGFVHARDGASAARAVVEVGNAYLLDDTGASVPPSIHGLVD